jgi:4-amino-4-deoxy-L-arabinose transferase-like glycosyltransferase
MRRARPLPGWLDGSWLVVLAFVLAELAFAYPPAVVEADSVRVGYGIIHGAHTEQYFRARDLYGRSFSFGYYALFWAIFPRLYPSFIALGAAMNALSLLTTALALIVFHRWVKRLLGARVALGSLLLMAATPVVFELGGYGHPEGPAFLALNLAIWGLVRAFARDRRRPAWLAGAALLAWVAATLRADVLLAFPSFPFLAAAAAGSNRRFRALAAGTLVAAAAALAYFAVQSAVLALAPARVLPVPGGHFSGQPGMLRMLVEYWRNATSVGALLKGAAGWITGLGPVLLALGAIGLLPLLRHREERSFGLAALAMILPSAIFWLPNPTPSRHLLLTFLGLTPAAVYWLAERFPGRRFALTVGLTLALNLIAMDAVRPVIVRNYRFAFVNLLPRRVNLWVPMGNPIAARVWARRQVRLELEETRQLLTTIEPRVFVFGGWVAVRLIHALYARGDYQVAYEWRHESFMYHVTTPRTEYVIYDYAGPPSMPPAELMARIAAAGDYRNFAFAIVPSDQPVTGAASIPAGYRELSIALPDWLDRLNRR